VYPAEAEDASDLFGETDAYLLCAGFEVCAPQVIGCHFWGGFAEEGHYGGCDREKKRAFPAMN